MFIPIKSEIRQEGHIDDGRAHKINATQQEGCSKELIEELLAHTHTFFIFSKLTHHFFLPTQFADEASHSF